jgi:hypothetical protein
MSAPCIKLARMPQSKRDFAGLTSQWSGRFRAARFSAAHRRVRDTGNEAGRAGRNLNKAAIAAGHFLENQTQAVGKTLSDAEKRVRDGKLIDAIWHVSTDPLRHSEENLAEAVSESKLLNCIATAAASIYGGPAGAAAYASWFTYKQTGNLQLALKAGVIAGATAQGLQMVNGMPSDTTDQLIKKDPSLCEYRRHGRSR